MPEAQTLHAAARIPLPDPQAMLDRLCAHFVEHGHVRLEGSRGSIESSFGTAYLAADTDALTLRAECPDDIALSIVKASLSEHVVAFAGQAPPQFEWTGDCASERALPYFHEMRVTDAYNVTPRMRRVVLAGDVDRLVRGGMHVRVLIPPVDRAPCWPRAGTDGRIVWPTGDNALTPRVYTIRTIDRLRGKIHIDVMLHPDLMTPGSIWAMRSAPGDIVGLLGPGGGNLEDADIYLFVGDETALPAIARMLAALPSDKHALLYVEVADSEEEQLLSSKANCEIHWLHRSTVTSYSCGLLHAVAGLDWSRFADRKLFVFGGCEHSSAKAIRRHLRKDRGMPNATHQIAGYWRRGHKADDSASA